MTTEKSRLENEVNQFLSLERSYDDAGTLFELSQEEKDDAIIALRESVKNAAGAQLENGVLSAHDFITQVDAEDQARQSLILHRIELLQAQFNYQNTTGNVRKQ